MRNFFSGFFQLGYVTRDLDLALEAYRGKFGEVEFLINEPGPIDGAPSPTKRIALTYIDDIMTEIIQPNESQSTIYDDALPAEPGVLQLHHLGYAIDDHLAMIERCADMGYQVPFHGMISGFMDYSYADTRAELGHYCEFMKLYKGADAFFADVPRLKTR